MCHLQGVNDDVMRHLSHKQVRFSVVIRNWDRNDRNLIETSLTCWIFRASIYAFSHSSYVQLVAIGFEEDQVENAGCIPKILLCFPFYFHFNCCSWYMRVFNFICFLLFCNEAIAFQQKFETISISPQKTRQLDTTSSSPSSGFLACTPHLPNGLSMKGNEATRAKLSSRASPTTTRSLKNAKSSPENHHLRIDFHDFEIENALQKAQQVWITVWLLTRHRFPPQIFQGVQVPWNESETSASANVSFWGVKNLQCSLGGQCWSWCRYDKDYIQRFVKWKPCIVVQY